MVRGAFCNDVVLDLPVVSCSMDFKDYHNVLEHHLVTFLCHRRHLNYVFQQDNAYNHVSRATDEWLQCQ